MSAPTTINGTTDNGAETVAWKLEVASKPQPVPTRGLIDVEVLTSNEIRLTPRCDLGRSLLSMWMGMDVKMSVVMHSGPNGDWKYGKTLDFAEMVFSSRPMLSKGDDPFFTGMSIRPDEYEELRAHLDKIRAKRAEEVRAVAVNGSVRPSRSRKRSAR